MESAAKRKAGGAAASENEGRPSKRQKDTAKAGAEAETPEATTTMGLKFLESLKQAKDKTGRPISVHFLTLPDKNQLPEYYDVIKLPIAIDTIEDKLNRREYSSLAQVESDCKRLVNNAKSYNDRKSAIYEDAERLRKTASNWMVKHNPAYRREGYQAIATPVPGEEPVPYGKPIPRVHPSTPKAAPSTPDTSSAERPRRAAAVAATQAVTPAPSKLRQSASAAPEEGDNTDFNRKSFQQAQEQIITGLINYVEPDSGLQIFLPFVNLPSRALKDYYQLIKDPVSLTAVQKKVRGVIGRNAPTGVTELKSWDAFEQMASMIWTNARIYNEDGSDLYNLSMELEQIFKQRLAEAKSKVEEPPQPKLKLNMSTAAPSPTPVPKQALKIKLRQSPVSDANTPAPQNSATPGVIVDNEALLRQQKHVLESMNGSRSSRPPSAGKAQTPTAVSNPFSGPRGASAAIPPLPAAQTRTAGSPSAVNGIKNDVQSPALNAIRPASTASDSQRLSVPAHTPHPVMAPPQSTSRPPSGSPHPNGPIGQQTGGYAIPYAPPAPSYYAPPVTPHFENFRKVPLKSVDEALIPKIAINTHPALNLPKPWSVLIPANKSKTSHSVTIPVPMTHSYLQITPHVPIALTNRLYRLFVMVNGNKAFEVNRVPVTAGINGSSPQPGIESGKKKGEPVYEAKLMVGVNRVEVEIVAEKERKPGEKESRDPKEQIESEKATIFLHLTRSL
ncbi:Bromodomain-containing protein [Bimuria novae-zelandiae CBS 107.79]|uniref:Bromodomain-containing protein n=1 Tax=Bimuria novae-zelandiae CBS 107.79 TaxID=1447943 RepID=A0A6A5VPM8_9PLEO|nr:Bromodomain-containing protein [Bimuria novae-zelandiae CBS 107.79]